jgi:hypothetical protein
MIPFALLLLAVSNRVELVNADYQIAPADWQWVPIHLKQRPALLSAVYQVRSGSSDVRLLVMRREDLDDMPHGSLAQTEEGRVGNVSHYLHDLGEYGLVVENRDARAPADVRLSIWLDFAPRRTVETLSPRRQFSIVAISLAVFFGIVTWSARQLLRAMKSS